MIALAVAASIALSLAAAVVAWRFACVFAADLRGKRVPFLALVASFGAWGSLVSLVEVPLVVEFAALWALGALVLRASSARKERAMLAANLVAAGMAMAQLLVFALAAMASGSTVWRLNADPFWCPALLAVGFAAFIVAALAAERLMKDHFPLMEGGDRAHFTLLWFSRFAVVYVLFDALPSLMRLDLALLSAFLAASTALLAVSLAAFVASSSRLGREAHLEQEYLELVERRDTQERRLDGLRAAAFVDSLTGLASRRGAVAVVEGLLARGKAFSLAYLDMNDLKLVNDAHGHEAGDACLVRLAASLRAAFGPEATVCRMSGDEFLVVLEGGGAGDVERGVHAAQEALARDEVPGVGPVTFSFGVAAVPQGSAASAAEVIGRTDGLMYEGKRAFHAASGEVR